MKISTKNKIKCFIFGHKWKMLMTIGGFAGWRCIRCGTKHKKIGYKVPNKRSWR